MSYKRESTRILAGAMNTAVQPPELLPENQASVIQDCDYSAQGGLRSRFGHIQVSSVGGAVKQILPGNGHRYVVAGGSLYRDGGAIGAASVNGIASFQGKMWSIVAKKKDVDGQFLDWIPKAPKTPPSGVATDQSTFTLADAGVAWTVDPIETGTGPDPAGFIVQTIDDKTYTATFGVGADLSDFHVWDKHRIKLFFKQAKFLGGTGTSGITVQVDVNTGDFTTDFYTCELPRRTFKGLAPREWSKTVIRFSEQPGDDTPFFTRIGNTPSQDWSTVKAVRIIIDSNTTTRVKIGKWDVYGAKKPSIEGKDIQYYATFISKDQEESDPSPVSGFIAADRQAIKVTNIPQSMDPQVLNGGGIFLYRKGGTLGAIYRVFAKPLPPGTTDFTDDNGDDVLTALGRQMENDNDDPPGAQGLAGPYQGRLIAWGGTKASRIYWTKQNRPAAFRNPDGPDGAWADVGDDGDAIVQMIVRPNIIHIYKGFDIYLLVGDPDGQSGVCQRSNARMGIPGPTAVCAGTNTDYFASEAGQGIYQFNGDTATKISQAVDPIFKGLAITLPSGNVIPPVGDWSTMALGFSGSRLYVSYDTTGLIWNAETGEWRQDSRRFTAFYPDSNMLAGDAHGNILQLESGVTDNGSPLHIIYEKTFDAHLPDTEKTWQDLTIQLNSNGQTVTAVAYPNTGPSISLSGFSGSGRFVQRFTADPNNPTRSTKVTVRLECMATAEVDIQGVWLNWYAHARQGETHDTSSQTFGTDKLKRIREFKVEMEGGANITLLTDHPGEGMAVRESQTIPSSTARRMARVVWSQDFTGYLIRAFLNSDTLNIYNIWALIQPIGTHLLGSRGEFYLSDPIDWGSERIKWCKELQVVYASTAIGKLILETNEPGQTLGVRASFDLPSTAASVFTMNEEVTLKCRLPETIKGREYRVRVTCGGDLRLEAVRAYVKVVGTAGTEPWDWKNFPVEFTEDAKWVAVPHGPDELS